MGRRSRAGLRLDAFDEVLLEIIRIYIHVFELLRETPRNLDFDRSGFSPDDSKIMVPEKLRRFPYATGLVRRYSTFLGRSDKGFPQRPRAHPSHAGFTIVSARLDLGRW